MRRSQDPNILGADIFAAVQKIQKDFQDHRIRKDEYDLRMSQLNRWIEARNRLLGLAR